VTYAEKIGPAERRLDPGRTAAELERVVRALTPGIGAYVELEGGERLGVEEARAVDAPLGAGELAVEDGRLLAGCAAGALELLRVRPAGGRTMAAADYLRGHDPGLRFAG
jgi:methionyl-tRNA formyltransferase